MKSSRLKKIVIAILALLNACLLVLLVSRKLQERAARERTVTQLIALFSAHGISLERSCIPRGSLLPSQLDPARDAEKETAFAEALLGPCETEDVGGGICRYVGAGGQCLLRSSGAVDASPGLAVDDPASYCAALFESCGCEPLSSDLAGGSGVVSARWALSGTPVFNARLTLTFYDGVLLSADGYFLPPAAMLEEAGGIDAVTALTRFLDYSTQNGEVCTAVTALQAGYLLQSTSSSPQHLAPAWCVTTDVGQYYVNITTGEVSREA